MAPNNTIESSAFIVTIDGPAGSGKTTVSRLVAEAMEFDYVDTGALYRGVALAAVDAGIKLDDDDALDRMCRSMTIDLVRETDGLHLFVDGTDVSGKIRTPKISMAASTVSARPVVRSYLLKLQRDLGRNRRAIFEGRDMGTVVFPEADIKIFLDADINVRVQRRHREMVQAHGATLKQVQADMIRRDKNDASRAVAPLKAADDAVLVDTTDRSIPQVVALIVNLVTDRLNQGI